MAINPKFRAMYSQERQAIQTKISELQKLKNSAEQSRLAAIADIKDLDVGIDNLLQDIAFLDTVLLSKT